MVSIVRLDKQRTQACSLQATQACSLQATQACLQALRKADEVRADTKGRTLARRNTHARTDHIQNCEDDRGEDREGRDLIHGDGATGDQQCRGRDKETFNKIFDDTIDDFSNTSVHYIFIE